MAYTITRTNGLNPIVIPDGTINTSTSMTLIGKNYPNYGAILDQNFIVLLENSASPNKPTSPIVGQLWWDSANNILKVNTDGGTGDSSWKNVGSTTSGPTKPTGNNNIGDLWWDTTNGQLWAYDGTLLDYKLIGPIGGAAGVTSETIIDTTDGTNNVLSMTIGGTRYAILSASVAFQPKVPIPGFTTIFPGLNLISQTALANSRFVGQTTDAVTLSGISSSSFMRSDINTQTTGTITVNNNNGLFVGTGSNFHVSVASPNVSVINETNNGHMQFKVHNSGGTELTAINIFPNGNVLCNYDLIVNGNFSLGSSLTDLILSGTSASINTATGALRLTAGGLGIFGNINTGGSQNNFVGNVRANNLNSNGVVAGATIVSAGNITGTIATAAQPYVTSLGTLSSLTVNGAVGATTIRGLIATNAQPFITNVGTLTSLTVSGNANLGSNSTVKITGGTSGQYMITDGNGNLSWSSIVGTNNQIPYFANGILQGNANLTYNGSILYVGGNINATGDITAFYTSDRNLKTNLSVINDALAKLDTLTGFTFNWNDVSGKDTTVREAGVIAQDVQAVLPEVVTERENGYLAVRYDKIIPLLIQAIKELRAEVELLKAAK